MATPHPALETLRHALVLAQKEAARLAGTQSNAFIDHDLAATARNLRAMVERLGYLERGESIPFEKTPQDPEGRTPNIELQFDEGRDRSYRQYLNRKLGLVASYYANIGEFGRPVITLSSQTVLVAKLVNVHQDTDFDTAQRLAAAWNFFLGMTTSDIHLMKPARHHRLRRGFTYAFEGASRLVADRSEPEEV